MAFNGQVRGFGLNGKSFYSNISKPCQVNLNWVVDSTNGNGLGIRSLKSNGYVNNVFMHTSAGAGTNNGFINPNPAVGFAIIQLFQNFNYFVGMDGGFVTAVQTSTKIDNSVLVVGQVYVITVLGNATLAQWQAVGVPQGITPAVGVAFVALTVGAGGNVLTSRVQLPLSSGIEQLEVVGDTNTMISNNIYTQAGQQLIVQFSGATGAGDTTMIPKAPVNGSVCGLSLLFDGSTVSIDGL